MATPTQTTEQIAVGGTPLSVTLAGDETAPAFLLLHGVPNAARMFQPIFPPLSAHCRLIAPDLPGFGASDPIDNASFSGIADIVEALLDRLGVEETFLYVHDFGAPIALHLATRRPDRVLGLVVQNGNAFPSGLGPQWDQVRAFWTRPDARNTAAAFAHLTFEGTRAQYVDNVPDDIAAQMDPKDWEEDWRVLSLPGRLDLHKDLIRDYKRHVDRFGEIAAYLETHQPPTLLLWGRHDPYFDLDEIQSWIEVLPRMEAHILDGPHLLLETHAELCGALIVRFVANALKSGNAARGPRARENEP